MINIKRAGVAVVVGLIASTVGLAGPVEAHSTGLHDNCTNLQKKWPHGVGLKNARDRGGNVTNFRRNSDAYRTANRHNGDLDRDNDGIACEKA